MTIDADTMREYRRLRRPDWEHSRHGWQSPARIALNNARTRVRFSRIGAIYYSTSDRLGAPVERAYQDYGNEHPYVRLLLVPDYDGVAVALDFDCCGEDNTGARWQACTCRAVQREIEECSNPRRAQRSCRYGQPCRHKCDEAQRIDRDGVYGVVAEYRDPDLGWTEADSCWGFVGDDWQEHCADVDFMDSAMRALVTGPAC